VIEAFVNGGDRGPPAAIVAIPARNEADRITRCLSALAMQRDHIGAPVVPGSFAVLVLANNCSDATAALARRLATQVPYPLWVLEVTLTGDRATAGGARRRAMDEAAKRLDPVIGEGLILTTDADSVVSPTWFAENMRALRDGADCVAGYIDAEPTEIVGLERSKARLLDDRR
jgi:cellulose synthase/poly-beta-1,6-N-acetylglucosamine synthase-like glycosyltransferase